MLRKYAFSILLSMYCGSLLCAQQQDSLFAFTQNNRLVLHHTVQKDETLYTIATYYSVPAVVLSQFNDVSFYDPLATGRVLNIPLGNYNFSQVAPAQWKPLYYSIPPQASYADVAAQVQIDASVLQTINQNQLKHPVLLGWVHIVAPIVVQASAAKKPLSTAPVVDKRVSVQKAKDSLKKPLSTFELVYNYQTSDGKFVDSLEGTVVFYKPQSAVLSEMLYAFSNDLARGRVVKVVNPSNHKFVFVKIIANLPSTKQYLNAKLGVDGRAMSILGIRDTKLWCSLYLKY